MFWLLLSPHNNANGNANIISRLIMLAIFQTAYFWAAWKFWNAFLVEYRYGVRLLADCPLSKERWRDEVGRGDEHADLVPTLPMTSNRIRTERLRYPWPSAVCTLLLVVVYLQAGIQIPAWNLFAFSAFCLFMIRPMMRWCQYSESTEAYERIEARDEQFLPLDKHLVCIDDSNFYRFHHRCLCDLGFEQIKRRRFQHYFAQPGGCVVVILGRDRHKRWDYISLVSVDDSGCVIESHSNEVALREMADAQSMWRLQQIDAGDVVAALNCHQQFVESNIDGPRKLVDVHSYMETSEHIHEVIARAKIMHFNEKLVSFA